MITSCHHLLLLRYNINTKKDRGEVGRRGKFWDNNKLVVVALFATKNKRKKKRQWHACVITFFAFNKNKN